MKHISYASSALVFFGVVFVIGPALYWIWVALPILFVILGIWLLCATMCFGTFMFISKGHAMWILDRQGDVKPIAQRRRADPK